MNQMLLKCQSMLVVVLNLLWHDVIKWQKTMLLVLAHIFYKQNLQLYWEEGDEEGIGFTRRRKRIAAGEHSIDEEQEGDDDDVPIDVLENMRDRSARDHCSDEAVGRTIFKRSAFLLLKHIQYFNMSIE